MPHKSHALTAPLLSTSAQWAGSPVGLAPPNRPTEQRALHIWRAAVSKDLLATDFVTPKWAEGSSRRDPGRPQGGPRWPQAAPEGTAGGPRAPQGGQIQAASVSCTFENMNPRKTRVFLSPRGRPRAFRKPFGLVFYEVLILKLVQNLGLAEFFDQMCRPNRVILGPRCQKPRVLRAEKQGALEPCGGAGCGGVGPGGRGFEEFTLGKR